MVEALHHAGLEVILDVVFNHSAEAGETGPSLSLRGLDERTVYRHAADGRCLNWTGCGNTMNFGEPRVVQLTLDALRYWVEEFRIDGFRFDLATCLGRGPSGAFDVAAPLLVALAQDPVLARAKLIAEPWDLGPNGYRLGGFPRRWLEWNDRFRDGVRRFWLRGDVDRAEFARRLAGSSDVFDRELRAPDRVGQLHRRPRWLHARRPGQLHAQAQPRQRRGQPRRPRSQLLEQLRDRGSERRPPGPGPARAAASGPADACLFVSQGTPMLLAGDELGHSQAGNNNAYCQDNPTTWIDWATIDEPLLEFVRALITLRREHPALRRRRFLTGAQTEEIGWYSPSGAPMTGADWADPGARCVAMYLDGSDAPDRDDQGAPLVDDDLLLLVNGWSGAVSSHPSTPSVGHHVVDHARLVHTQRHSGVRHPELRPGRSWLVGHRPGEQ